MLLREYIQNLDYPEKLKSRVFSEEILQKHIFFINLVDYFSPLFTNISKDKLVRLSGCSYLYYRSILFFDKVIDKQLSDEELPNVLLNLELFEKSVKDLSILFEEGSLFWKKFAKLKESYKAYVSEEKELNNSKADFEDSKFEELANGKSLLVHNIINALEVLSGESVHSSELYEIIRCINIAFQYHDDINDFSRDLESGQWTLAQCEVSKFLSNEGIELEKKFFINAFFVSGIGEELMQRVLSFYAKAKDKVDSLNLDQLSKFLQASINKVNFHILEINALVHKNEAISKRNYKLLYSKSDKLSKFLIKKSYLKVIDFLNTNQSTEGYWSDFATSKGLSSIWVTGYVVNNISESHSNSLINSITVKDYLSGISTNSAFNEKSPKDGDSTSFCIAAYKSLSLPVDKNMLENWFSFMETNGGWFTYHHSDALRDFTGLDTFEELKGWITPQNCVTSVSFYLLAKYKFDSNRLILTHNYLKEIIEANKFVPSYWWSSPIYATVYTLLGLIELGLEETHDFKKLENFIALSQTLNGSWIDDYGYESCFFTSLATIALLKVNSKKYKSLTSRSIKWLIENQFEDGSFKVEHILRMPSPGAMQKDLNSIQWKRASLGVNVLTDDHKRVFTSSVALNAIKNYAKCHY